MVKKKIEIKEEVEKVAVPGKKKTKTIRTSSGTGTVLIICEKPAAAEKIADALSDGKDHKIMENGVPIYEFNKNGKRIVVGCAVGHLFGIAEDKKEKKRADIPSFDVIWKPSFETKNKAAGFTKKYYSVLKKLAGEADEFIVATDLDIEGEVIGWNVVRFIAKQKDAKRMKFSSLTKDELNKSYDNLSPTLDWGLAVAGETRHYVDWFYGINLSRALMRSLSKAGRFRIMSIGRVQGPALKIIVDKELEIQKFVPEPYWQVFLQIQDMNNKKLEVKYPKDIFKESELLKFKQLKGKKALAKTEISEDKVEPPTPFDLTTLQTESYRFFGLTPSQTLAVAQKLYLDSLISYPRTSSQQYPEAIGYDKIMKTLGKNFSFTKYAVNKKPVEGKKTDPAHPAIYPTGEFKKLEGDAKNVYELVVRRFVSCFCDNAIVENKKVIVEVNGLEFNAKGAEIKSKGWMNVYKDNIKEEEIPTINGEVNIKELRIEQKMTQPPRRYTASSLLKELEKRSLGTKATRSAIIETLYTRGYVKEKSIEATPLALKLVETLEKYSPIIIDENLTRELENEMEAMQVDTKNFEEKEKIILDKAKKIIITITGDMRKKEEEIGKALAEGNQEMWDQEKEANKLNLCPKCGKGNLRLVFNRMSHRSFVGCSNYPECKNTYSLPPNALIKPADKVCEECGYPKLLAIRKAKRPWEFCFNPECKTNEEWMKKREEYAKEKAKEEKVGSKEDSGKKEIDK